MKVKDLYKTVINNSKDLKIEQPSFIPKTLTKLESGYDTTIVVVGDSIVQGLRPIGHLNYDEGWVYKLAEKIATIYPNSTVIASLGMSGNSSNTGENGCTIVDFKDYTIQTGTNGQTITIVRSGVGGDTLPRIFARSNTWMKYNDSIPDLIIVNEGINDLLKNDKKKYITEDVYETYYKTMLHYIKYVLKCEVVCNNIHWAGESPTVQFNEFFTRQKVIKKCCKIEKIQMIDQNSVWVNHYQEGVGLYGQGTWLENSDYCHPAKDGQQAIADKVFLDLFKYNQKIIPIAEENVSIIPYTELKITKSGFGENTVKRNDGSVAYKTLISNDINGATLTTEVKGSTIYLLARKGKYLGNCNVTIDGKDIGNIDFKNDYPEDVSGYTDSAVISCIYSRHLIATGLEDTTHTITIKVESGVQYVPFYGFEVQHLNTENNVVRNTGSIKFVLDNNSNYMSQQITFPKPHKNIPIVQVNSRNVRINACSNAETKDGCVVFIGTTNGNNFSPGELTITYYSVDRDE